MEKLGKGSVRSVVEMGNYTSSSGIWTPNSSFMTGSEESTTERIPLRCRVRSLATVVVTVLV